MVKQIFNVYMDGSIRRDGDIRHGYKTISVLAPAGADPKEIEEYMRRNPPSEFLEMKFVNVKPTEVIDLEVGL